MNDDGLQSTLESPEASFHHRSSLFNTSLFF